MFLSSVKVQSFRSYFDDKHPVYKTRNRTAIRARPIFILSSGPARRLNCMRKMSRISVRKRCPKLHASGIYIPTRTRRPGISYRRRSACSETIAKTSHHPYADTSSNSRPVEIGGQIPDLRQATA